MPVLVNITFEIITEESRENCDAEERGFDAEDSPYTFRELVDLLRRHPEPSEWPMREAGAWAWFSNEGDTDIQTGDERRTSVHFSSSNVLRAAKYWNKAARAAGLLSA